MGDRMSTCTLGKTESTRHRSGVTDTLEQLDGVTYGKHSHVRCNLDDAIACPCTISLGVENRVIFYLHNLDGIIDGLCNVGTEGSPVGVTGQ